MNKLCKEMDNEKPKESRDSDIGVNRKKRSLPDEK